jgi:hypothetical protein
MSSPLDKAWYLLLAANDCLRARAYGEPLFFALPCEMLYELVMQIEPRGRSSRRAHIGKLF